jgi:hypothetical protein
MCLNPNCKYIEIYEIKEDVKVCLHYSATNTPIFIQIWDDNLGIDTEYQMKLKNRKTRKNRNKRIVLFSEK